MAIKVLLTLDSTDFKNGIADAQKTAEDFASHLSGVTGGEGVNEFTANIASAEPAIQSATSSARDLAEALHILNIGLREAGVSVGEFGALTRLASRGIETLGIAIGVAAVVGLATLEEKTASTQAKLTGLFGSVALGQQAFSVLKKSSDDLHVSVDALEPSFEAATEALQKFSQLGSSVKFVAFDTANLPGVVGGINAVNAAIDNLFKGIRAGGATTAEATQQTNAFFTILKNGGVITKEALAQLNPEAVRLLGQAFGITGSQFQLIGRNIADVINNVSRAGPIFQQAFDANAVISFTDALRDLRNVISDNLGEGTLFSSVLTKAIELVVDAVRILAAEFVLLKTAIQEIIGLISGIPGIGAAFKLVGDAIKIVVDLVSLLAQFLISKLPEATQKAFQPLLDAIAKLKTDLAGIQTQTQQTSTTFVGVGQSSATAFAQAGQGAQTALDKVNAFNAATGRAQIAVGEAATLSNNTFRQTTNTAAQATQAINDLARNSGTFAERLTLQFQGFIPTQKTITTGFQDSSAAAKTATQRIQEDFEALKSQVQTTGGQIKQAIIDAFTHPLSAGEKASLAGESGLPGFSLQDVQGALGKIKAAWDEFWQNLKVPAEFGIDLSDVPAPDFSEISKAFATATSGLVSAAQEIWNQINAVFQKQIVIPAPVIAGGSGSGGSGEIALARGGLVIGPGSGTSDSILARLSNMEFVMSSRATAFYGSGFMSALNSLVVPRDILPGFSMGGLVRAIGAVPGFAAGGLNSSLRPITINIAGKGSFAGNINAPESVVAMLSSEAVFEQLAAGGRSPGWRRT